MTHLDLILRYVQDVWTEGRVDLLSEYVDDDCRFSDLYGDTVLVGRKAVADSIAQWLSMFARHEGRVLHSVADDDRIAWQWSVTGTWSDTPPLGYGDEKRPRWPAGKSVVVAGIAFTTIKAGRIIHEQNQSDTQGLVEQMGYSLR